MEKKDYPPAIVRGIRLFNQRTLNGLQGLIKDGSITPDMTVLQAMDVIEKLITE